MFEAGNPFNTSYGTINVGPRGTTSPPTADLYPGDTGASVYPIMPSGRVRVTDGNGMAGDSHQILSGRLTLVMLEVLIVLGIGAYVWTRHIQGGP
jgi:hypothetical protein